MNTPNTPTTWKLIISETDKPVIVDSDGYSIARTATNSVPENVANAELILRAVNYHDRLVECLEKCRRLIDSEGYSFDEIDELLTEIKESK